MKYKKKFILRAHIKVESQSKAAKCTVLLLLAIAIFIKTTGFTGIFRVQLFTKCVQALRIVKGKSVTLQARGAQRVPGSYGSQIT